MNWQKDAKDYAKEYEQDAPDVPKGYMWYLDFISRVLIRILYVVERS